MLLISTGYVMAFLRQSVCTQTGTVSIVKFPPLVNFRQTGNGLHLHRSIPLHSYERYRALQCVLHIHPFSLGFSILLKTSMWSGRARLEPPVPTSKDSQGLTQDDFGRLINSEKTSQWTLVWCFLFNVLVSKDYTQLHNDVLAIFVTTAYWDCSCHGIKSSRSGFKLSWKELHNSSQNC